VSGHPRIAINGWFLQHPQTGSGQYLRCLLRWVQRLASLPDLVLVAPGLDRLGRVEAERELGLDVAAVGGAESALGKLYFEQVTFPCVARRLGAHILHVPYWGSPMLPAVPCVVSVLDVIPLVLPEYRGGPYNRAYFRLAAAAARRAKAVLTISAAARDDIERATGIPVGRMHITLLGADHVDGFGLSASTLERFRPRFDPETSFVLYVGGFDRRKNLETALRGFALALPSLGPVTPFVIAGSLPTSTAARQVDPRPAVRELGLERSVVFLGAVTEDEKAALMRRAAAFVFPSRYEGFGLPALEAMRCGAPVIAARTAVAEEVLGDAAILCHPGDPASFRDALVRVLGDPAVAADLRASGLARAAGFSWQRCAQQTADVYGLIADDSGAQRGPGAI